MRTLTIALLLAAVGTAAHAADIAATSAVESVVVFPRGAEITRVAKVTIDKGDHTLVFRDLPAEAVEGSIRVEGNATGKLEIGSVDTRRLFVPQADAAANETERRGIERDLEALRDQKATLEAQIQGAETQKVADRKTRRAADASGSGRDRREGRRVDRYPRAHRQRYGRRAAVRCSMLRSRSATWIARFRISRTSSAKSSRRKSSGRKPRCSSRRSLRSKPT